MEMRGAWEMGLRPQCRVDLAEEVWRNGWGAEGDWRNGWGMKGQPSGEVSGEEQPPGN